MANKKVVLVHTSFAVIDLFNGLFDELIPEVGRIHIVEHSLIQDILDAGRVTPEVMRRMCGYFLQADSIGPDAIFSVCSTAEVSTRATTVSPATKRSSAPGTIT